MKYLNSIYYNLLAIQNNIILNILLIGNIIYPTYFIDKINYYKNKIDNYYKFINLLIFRDKIEKTYKIDILNIGLELYEKYKTIKNNNDSCDDTNSIISNLSEISDLNDLSDFSEIEDN